MPILFPDEIVIKTNNFTVAQDWEVAIPAFFIVSTNRKIFSLGDFNNDEADEFGRLIRDVRKGMKEELNCKEVYLFQNEDSEHGFHLWMFPRYEWMDRFGRKIQSVRQILDYVENQEPTEEIVLEVKEAVNKMKIFLNEVVKTKSI